MPTDGLKWGETAPPNSFGLLLRYRIRIGPVGIVGCGGCIRRITGTGVIRIIIKVRRSHNMGFKNE